MGKTISQIRDEMVHREAIRDVILRYCRASDRVDEDMLRDVYWPDAQDDHLEFSGNPEEFIAYCKPILTHMKYNMHTVGNMLIDVDGDDADAESYFIGYHSIPDEAGVRRDYLAAGRYIDKFQKRGDEWKILKRLVTVEWFREFPDTGDWDVGPFGMKVPRGDLKPNDVSYGVLDRL